MTLLLAFIGLAALAACATGSAGSATDGTHAGRTAAGSPVMLDSVADVAGRWEGFADLPGHRSEDQYVEMTLHRDGTYQANAARTIGLMDAHGRVQLSDGRLQVLGDGGARGTATLFAQNGERTLQVEMATSRGGRVTARLRPKP